MRVKGWDWCRRHGVTKDNALRSELLSVAMALLPAVVPGSIRATPGLPWGGRLEKDLRNPPKAPPAALPLCSPEFMFYYFLPEPYILLRACNFSHVTMPDGADLCSPVARAPRRHLPRPRPFQRAATHRSPSGGARKSRSNPKTCPSATETWDLFIALHKAQPLLPWVHGGGGSADEGAVQNPTPPGHWFRAIHASNIQIQFYFMSFDCLQRAVSLLHGGIGMATKQQLLLFLTARLHLKKQLKSNLSQAFPYQSLRHSLTW